MYFVKNSKLNFWTKVYFQVIFQCVMFSDLEDLDIICFGICERVYNQSPLTLEQHGFAACGPTCRWIVFSKHAALHGLHSVDLWMWRQLWDLSICGLAHPQQALEVSPQAQRPLQILSLWRKWMILIFLSLAFFFFNLTAGFRKCIIHIFFQNNLKWRVKILKKNSALWILMT